MATALPVAEVLRRKRDGQRLGADDIQGLIAGIRKRSIDPAQLGAFTMAVRLRGMDLDETVALTLAMRDSGRCLRWPLDAGLGPVLDKHSTGGVGDATSLILAPLLAACGARVPMISGRGLGHTGGTLDKLEAIPGYQVRPNLGTLRRVLREVGCAIVGAGPTLAPADRALYAVRDVTATVDSIPLITASILSKKLAAGLDALVLDVKTGSGAFLPDPQQAAALATSLLQVAGRCGLRSVALLTDMDQPLANAAGNSLELNAVFDVLRGNNAGSRLARLALRLAGEALVAGGLAADAEQAQRRLQEVLQRGYAAERFARMVAALGGPADLLEHTPRYLPAAPLICAVSASEDGYLQRWDSRALGLCVVALGGGRARRSDAIDPRVGLSGIAAVGSRVERGQALAWVHAANERAAAQAVAEVRAAARLGPAAPTERPLVLQRLAED